MKSCCMCLREFAPNEMNENFTKDKSRRGGYAAYCRKCKREYDKKRNLAIKYKDLSDHIKRKNNLRTQAKTKFKNVKECSVIGCNSKPELHHIDYKDNSSVIAVCRHHHSKIHSLEKTLEDVVNGKIIHGSDVKLKEEIQKLKEQLADAEKVIDLFKKYRE